MSIRSPLVVVSLCFVVISSAPFVASHHDSGDWHCETDDQPRIDAQFRPGVITVDGRANEWIDVNGFEFPLRPALDPDEDKEYKAGKMTVKALHDGRDVYFLLQVDGDLAYSKGENRKCASASLMFQVGENATYHSMGGCKQSRDVCNSTNCRGHEVDIMQFTIGSSIPGRLYGSSSMKADGKADVDGLVDMYAWSPHCRHIDGSGSSGTVVNDWTGAWWHSSFSSHSEYIEEEAPYGSSGQAGTYFFEFSRPLRTTDRLQQDAQFTIGQTSRFSAAFWYPTDGAPWSGSSHYTIGCDWVPLGITSGSTLQAKAPSSSGWEAASGFAILFSSVAFGLSLFVWYAVSRSKSVAFTPLDRL